jgi:hypothetical protein
MKYLICLLIICFSGLLRAQTGGNQTKPNNTLSLKALAQEDKKKKTIEERKKREKEKADREEKLKQDKEKNPVTEKPVAAKEVKKVEKKNLYIDVNSILQLDTKEPILIVHLDALKNIATQGQPVKISVNSLSDSIYFQAEGFVDTSVTNQNLKKVELLKKVTRSPWYESSIFWISFGIYIGLLLVSFFLYKYIYLPRKKEKEKQYLVELKPDEVQEYLEKTGIGWPRFTELNPYIQSETDGKKKRDYFSNEKELKKFLKNKPYLFNFTPPEVSGNLNNNPGDTNTINKRLEGIEANIKTILEQDQNTKKISELTLLVQQKEQSIKDITVTLKEKEGAIAEQLNQIANFEKTYKTQEVTISNLQKEIDYFSDKIIKTPHLQAIGRGFSQYIEKLQSVPIAATDFYNECLVVEKDSLNTETVRKMIEKYNIGTLPMASSLGKWAQIMNLLKNTGCISDAILCQKLTRESLTNDEQKKLIREYIFRDLLNQYINNTLLLSEEMSNLHRFSGVQDQRAKAATHKFKPIVLQLLQQARQDANLEINYVPLFESYEKYTEFVREVDDEPGNLYQIVKELNRNDVIEVKSYGFKIINGFETTETKVIIKK